MQTFTDLSRPRFKGSYAELPRGLVRPPQEVLDMLAKERAKFPPGEFSDSYAKLTLDDWTLLYYYEDLHVAYRSVPEGVEVLAIGPEEIGRLFEGMTQEEILTITITQP